MSPTDPERLLREVILERKRKATFWRKFIWWATNRCTKCGGRLLTFEAYENESSQYFHIPICEWCEYRHNRHARHKSYKSGINWQVYWLVAIALLIAILLAIRNK